MNVFKNKSCLSRIIQLFLYINALATLIILLSHTLLSTERRIHPDYNYAISKARELDLYFLTSIGGNLQPQWLSFVGLQGIYLEDKKLYVQYHVDDFYLIYLDRIERVKLEKLPSHIKLIKPEIFWSHLQREWIPCYDASSR